MSSVGRAAASLAQVVEHTLGADRSVAAAGAEADAMIAGLMAAFAGSSDDRAVGAIAHARAVRRKADDVRLSLQRAAGAVASYRAMILGTGQATAVRVSRAGPEAPETAPQSVPQGLDETTFAVVRRIARPTPAVRRSARCTMQ